MSSTVFFSWQADIPTKQGRNFIERALEKAAKRIGNDTTVEHAIRDLKIDRDTKGVPGSPPIVETIFKKIDNSAVFVPDLTNVGRREDGRFTPNPNVLIEYGWALKSLGYGRIVPVMNTAFGEPTSDSMPFNLRHLRNPITYNCSQDADDQIRQRTREGLAKELEHALRAIFASEEFAADLPEPSTPPQYSPRPAEDGPGRFRPRGRPLGTNDGTRSFDVRLAEGPVAWFRLMATVDPGHIWHVTELKRIATGGSLLSPLIFRPDDTWWVRADDGFGVYTQQAADQPGTACSVAFAFRTGELWAIDALLLPEYVSQGEKVIPNVEVYFKDKLVSFSKFLTELGISSPYKWIGGVEDLKNRYPYAPLGSPAWLFRQQNPCLREVITMSGTYIPGASPQTSLAPFFNELFDACGVEWPGFRT